MPRLRGRKLSNRIVAGLCAGGRDTVFWDPELPGFGVRVYPSGSKVYVVQGRERGRSRRVTVGRHGALSADEARRRAARLIARIKRWEDPAPPSPAAARAEPTVADLARRYLDERVAPHCKPRTLALYRAVVHRHLLPAFGHLPITGLARDPVSSLHHRLRETPHAANRAVEVLGRIVGMAEDQGLRPPGANPCRSIDRYRPRRRGRFLSGEEYRRLGRALDEAEAGGGGASPSAVAAIRLLALTGCRRSEILSLRWEHVDPAAGELRLPDSKTGARRAPLSRAAAEVLSSLLRLPGNPWVIPGRKPGAPLRNLQHPWEVVRARAGLDDVRIHDLRHSFASRALALGESLPMIGELLGHRRVRTTARYAHLARDPVNASSARIADSIGADILLGGEPAPHEGPRDRNRGRTTENRP